MCFNCRAVGLAFPLLLALEAMVAAQYVPEQHQAPVRAYEVPDAVLLDYVKTQMLRGLGLQEAPRVRRAITQDDEYEQVYKEYQRRLEEDDLLNDAEDPQNYSGLQRLFTIRSNGGPLSERENGGVSQRVQFQIPEQASDNLVSARLRFRLNHKSHPHVCSVKIYKLEDDLKYLIGDLQTSNEVTTRTRAGRFRRVMDLTSSIKSWLRSSNDNLIELEILESHRGCLRGLPIFDIMAKELMASGSSRTKRSMNGSPMKRKPKVATPDSGKLGATKKMCTGNDDKACCMRSLNVSVADLGWDEWIIEPKFFEANFCRGQCLYKHGHFASSHAVLQSKISRIFGHKTVSRPCCAPTKLKALAVMYRNPDGKTSFGRIPKMIVEACACS